MSIVNELSSQVNDRTQEANRGVSERCLVDRGLLEDVAEGIRSAGKNAALLGDCAEVMTMVAEKRPELIAPYVDLLAPLLSHKTTRVRWEGMHAIALAADSAPERTVDLLPKLAEIVRNDSSTIVRDYAVDALGALVKSSEAAALSVYPILKEALAAWGGKHTGRALNGLCSVVGSAPSLAGEVEQLAREYADSGKPVVRKAAKALLKAAAVR